MHRYWVVLVFTLLILVFGIVAPPTEGARATVVALQGVSLLAAALAYGVSPTARRAIAAPLALIGLAVATVGLPLAAAVVIASVLAGITTLVLIVGLGRSVRAHGVTLQEVLGAIALYMLLGGFFAFVITAVSALDPSAYFAERSDGTLGEHVYYSFTVLTTTGFGDLTAASSSGRAVAVVEMLAGEFYLVTVISVLVSNMGGAILVILRRASRSK